MEFMDNFKQNGSLVMNEALISDELIRKIKYTDFFTYSHHDNKYFFAQKYDNVTKWAKNNTKLLDKVSEDAMNMGLTGIYKQDPKTKKWYTYDTNGKPKYYSELPDVVGKNIDKLGKSLYAAGIAIDVYELNESIQTHDISEILGTTGKIGGAYLGGRLGKYVVAEMSTGGSASVGLVITFFISSIGSYLGGMSGKQVGKKIEDAMKNGEMSWEYNE